MTRAYITTLLWICLTLPSFSQNVCEAFEAYQSYTGQCYSYSADYLCITLDASGSIDETGPPMGFAWDFGDGTIKKGIKAEHCYEKAGTYKAKLLTNTHVSGRAISEELVMPVVLGDIVKITYQKANKKGRSMLYNFDGSESYLGEDIKILGYYWDFGDGRYACDVNTSHEFVRADTYMVRLLIKAESKFDGEYMICGRQEIKVQ